MLLEFKLQAKPLSRPSTVQNYLSSGEHILIKSKFGGQSMTHYG